MTTHRVKCIIVFGLISMLLGEITAPLVPHRASASITSYEGDSEPAPTAGPTAEPSDEPEPTNVPVQPTVVPTPTKAPAQPTLQPTNTPAPAVYKLTSPKAKYSKGGQTGIKYRKIKGKKVYKITTYATDVVTLTMSHPTKFSVYGGGSKKEVTKKAVTVTAKGVVKGKNLYDNTGCFQDDRRETVYIHLFQKEIILSDGKESYFV